MKNAKIILFAILTLGALNLNAQTEIELIQETLNDYIEGTANGEPERLRDAFHENFKLYFVSQDSLKIWSGKHDISNVTPGKKSNRIGTIISIDYENNAASAKIQVDMPDKRRIYSDYLLLLKYEGRWKIIQKSFTYVSYP
ncbi:Putative lumazine-binding [Marivirga sericea]|uniref:Putative lumazine-binding n=1 Tax=Marivirga sericea TaxID=1028 RepID=A0A1X7K5I5_9BACT|nr:nuclear transport factor 2 family protein [Marivirga sericea]SMG36212.1 Putative lumazine-binding [Marivirga sericea]